MQRSHRREQPGDRIGVYKLLEQIGEGGFGAVYVAEQEEPLRRRVALKIIKLGMDTRFHQFIGTPEYISPEQAEMSDVEVDTRSDVDCTLLSWACRGSWWVNAGIVRQGCADPVPVSGSSSKSGRG